MALDLVDDFLVAGWIRKIMAYTRFEAKRSAAEIWLELTPLRRKLADFALRHVVDVIMVVGFVGMSVLGAALHAGTGVWDWQRGMYPRWPSPYLTTGELGNAAWLVLLAVPYILVPSGRANRRMRLKATRRYLIIPMAIGALAAPALVRPEGLYVCLGSFVVWVVLLGLRFDWWVVPILAVAGIGALTAGCLGGSLLWDYGVAFVAGVMVCGITAIASLMVAAAAAVAKA